MGTVFNLIILGFIVWFLYQRFVPVKGIKNINAAELKAVLNNKGNKQLIDVRTPNEYRGNHIKDFKNIPLNELGKRTQELSKDKERKGCLIVNTTSELANLEKEIADFVKKNMEDYEKLFQQLIKEGQQAGEISKSLSAVALSRHLFNSLAGLKIIGQTTNDRKTLEDIGKISLSVLQQ